MKVIEFNAINEKAINGKKIEEARLARKLSLAQLSEKIGVTSQAISKYEKGIIKPSSKVLIGLSDVLEFPINFFIDNSRNQEEIADNSIVYFRSNKNITKKMREACKVRIKWIDNTYNLICKYFELPSLDLPNIEIYDIDELNEEFIEKIAEQLREYWSLGNKPIGNLINILQKRGFIITRLNIGTKKIDGFSIWNNSTPYIFIGTEKDSAVRSRFDLAHELGHLILHKNITSDEFELEREMLEHQADMFAAAFLLPRESFSKEMINSSIDSLILLKRKWKVSLSAMIKRIQTIDILTENQIKYLKHQMCKYRYYVHEPLDDTIKSERPYLFKQAFELLVENNILTKSEIVEMLKLHKYEIIDLYSLDNNFFEDNESLLRVIK